jgi:hypothetical protein
MWSSLSSDNQAGGISVQTAVEPARGVRPGLYSNAVHSTRSKNHDGAANAAEACSAEIFDRFLASANA